MLVDVQNIIDRLENIKERVDEAYEYFNYCFDAQCYLLEKDHINELVNEYGLKLILNESYKLTGVELIEKKKKPKHVGVCGRCYAEDVPIFRAKCEENPTLLARTPIGQYHCPDCGAMLLAGEEHPFVCELCLKNEHPEFDAKRMAIKNRD